MRWLTFAILAILVLTLQAAVAPRIELFSARPDFLLIVVVFLGLYAPSKDAIARRLRNLEDGVWSEHNLTRILLKALVNRGRFDDRDSIGNETDVIRISQDIIGETTLY